MINRVPLLNNKVNGTGVCIAALSVQNEVSIPFLTRNVNGAGPLFQSDYTTYRAILRNITFNTNEAQGCMQFSTDGETFNDSALYASQFTALVNGNGGTGIQGPDATEILFAGNDGYTNTTIIPVNGYFDFFDPLSPTAYKGGIYDLNVGGYGNPTTFYSLLHGNFTFASLDEIYGFQYYTSSGLLSGDIYVYGIAP